MGHLGLTRYLTTDQLWRLVFAGRSQPVVSTRLGELSARTGGRKPWLKRLAYVNREARRILVWALTVEGYAIAEEVVGRKFKMPRHDVAPQFLEHSTGINELYVGLVARRGNKAVPWQAMRGKPATDFARVPDPAVWRWVPMEDLDLPFTQHDLSRAARVDRRLQPDAMIECARLKRRWLIEYETGTATVRNAEHRTATLTKLDRHDHFLARGANNEPTACMRHFGDTWDSELLFVTLTEPRRATIAQAISEYVESTRPRNRYLNAHALTLDQAKKEFRRLLLGETSARGQVPVAVVPTTRPTSEPRPAMPLSRSEMQLVLRYAAALHESFARAQAKAPSLAAQTAGILEAVAALHDGFRQLRAEARSANRPVPDYIAEEDRRFVLSLLDSRGVKRL